MTWLVLTCPIQVPTPNGPREQMVKRRFNADNMLVYEPNAMGTTIVMLGAQSVQQVTETANQIDAALSEVTHPLRVEEQAQHKTNNPPLSEYETWQYMNR
jgi:hypothetical protein